MFTLLLVLDFTQELRRRKGNECDPPEKIQRPEELSLKLPVCQMEALSCNLGVGGVVMLC